MPERQPLLLLIDDELPIRRFLQATLVGQGYDLVEAENGQAGIEQVAAQRPDVVLLDLGLPDMDGLEVTRRLRAWSRVPIIVLSARGQERDKVAALEAGADDYLTKPFGVAELLARIRVALRHAARAGKPSAEAHFQVGALRADLEQRRVFVGDAEIHLTPIEYQLLGILIRHAGKVVTQRQLLHDVWGPAYTGESHYLRVYMAQLRQKIETIPARPRYLLTEPGVGYRLAAE
jgi:two-component system KDP operon response regulator KdpE